MLKEVTKTAGKSLKERQRKSAEQNSKETRFKIVQKLRGGLEIYDLERETKAEQPDQGSSEISCNGQAMIRETVQPKEEDYVYDFYYGRAPSHLVEMSIEDWSSWTLSNATTDMMAASTSAEVNQHRKSRWVKLRISFFYKILPVHEIVG